jgi:predicted transcriptional regulator
MKKHKVIETLDQLPEEFNLEDLVEKLLFIEKVEKGIQDADQGRTMTLHEAKNKLEEKWQTLR